MFQWFARNSFHKVKDVTKANLTSNWNLFEILKQKFSNDIICSIYAETKFFPTKNWNKIFKIKLVLY